MEGSEGFRLTITAIWILAKNDGRIGRSKLRDAVDETVDAERKEKDPRGRPRWVGQLDHYAARYAKDIIGKERRVWFLTDQGRDLAYNDQGDVFAEKVIARRFKDWLENNSQESNGIVGQEQSSADNDDENGEPTQEQLGDSIADYIKGQDQKNSGKWFENLVAALLRGMGYQHVDSRGKSGDGGVDVIAYKDKLGAMLPRIKVQAKHYKKGDKPAPVREEALQRLASSVHSGEIGMCVTSSSFTKNAELFARNCDKHLELVDRDRLVELWEEHYHNMTDADKNMLPLKYSLDIKKVKEKPDAAD